MKLILVEPGGHHLSGHMREKILLAAVSLRELGVGVTLVGWAETPPPDVVLDDYVCPPSFVRHVAGWIPRKLTTLYIEFWVYLTAFIASRSGKMGVIGMTSSGPYGPVFASFFCHPPAAYLQRMIHPGLFPVSGGWGIVRRRALAWKCLVRNGGRLVCFNELMQTTFDQSVGPGATVCIPEFIALPGPEKITERKIRRLLATGWDNARRSPVGHLERLEDFAGLNEIIIHDPELNAEKLQPLRDRLATCPSVKLTGISGYFTGGAWLELFARADASLIAYAGTFPAMSALFLQSIACGLPVVSSRFPDGIECFARFGKLGELFDYGDRGTLSAAIARICAWSDLDWKEFFSAREGLLAAVNPASSLSQYLSFLKKQHACP
ncbi:MAG: glycosyltransferase [Candidatus Methylacidiphilales bacterium]|nr:glycosyltransferase [Candidatus Methylacidiphilales bacterium]